MFIYNVYFVKQNYKYIVIFFILVRFYCIKSLFSNKVKIAVLVKKKKTNKTRKQIYKIKIQTCLCKSELLFLKYILAIFSIIN